MTGSLYFLLLRIPTFKLSGGQDPGDTAKELIHSDMRIDPILLFHSAAGLCLAVHTERQCRYKQIHFAAVPCDLIIKEQRSPGPVDHQFIARLVLDMHGKLILRDIILI